MVTSTGGVRVISPTKRFRRDSLTIPMAVGALISSSPLAHGSPRQVAQVTPFPEGPWRPGALRRLLDDDNAFCSSWWLLFGLLALAFVRCPGLPRGDLGSQLADRTLQLLNSPSLALLHRGRGDAPRAQVKR